jgi:hypothetical protein
LTNRNTKYYYLPVSAGGESKQKQVYAVRLDADLRSRLRTVKEEVGITEGEQVRRALRIWFDEKRWLAKPKRSIR